VKGREFTWADNENATLVAVVNEAIVRQYWPGEDPVGKRLSIDTRNGKPVWRQIVGMDITRATRTGSAAAVAAGPQLSDSAVGPAHLDRDLPRSRSRSPSRFLAELKYVRIYPMQRGSESQRRASA
jgi:hypothetical protein